MTLPIFVFNYKCCVKKVNKTKRNRNLIWNAFSFSEQRHKQYKHHDKCQLIVCLFLTANLLNFLIINFLFQYLFITLILFA